MAELITILGATFTTGSRGGRTSTLKTIENVLGRAYNENVEEIDGKQTEVKEFVFKKKPFLGFIKDAGYTTKDISLRLNDDSVYQPREFQTVGNRILIKAYKDE